MLNEKGFEPNYQQALGEYLGLWVSRTSAFQVTIGRWITGLEAATHPFGMQSIAMVWDYPEVSLLTETSGGAPQPAILVQGDDELGALAKLHLKLHAADINVYASSGVADGKGSFGYAIYVRPDDFDAAVAALAI